MSVNRPEFVSQIVEMWRRLQRRQQINIVVFALLGLALIGGVVYLMNRVEYQTLYRDLSPDDARAITDKLKEDRRDFTVRGTSILVAAPEGEIDKLRLEISGAGLGRSGRIGYEIFDKNQFGMTDFTEQINLQRALEGELSRTISSLSEIFQARVHISLAKDSYFEESRESAKASVVLTLRKGAELSRSSIAGIRGVVAGAVPGLSIHNVSIVDEEGRVLAQSMESGDIARSEMESGIREQFEKDMSGKVISILEPLVGKKKVHAKASVDVDFNTTEQTEETFNPTPSVILSQQKSEERSGGILNSGIPGTQSNVGTALSESSESAGMERFRQSELTNYEVSKTVRHTVQPKGSIRRLSVAVILDDKTVYSKDKDGKVTEHSEPRAEKEIAAYKELVMAAVGYNAERGDVVSIENVSFHSDARPEEDAPSVPWHTRIMKNDYAMPVIKYGSFLLLFLLIYLIFLRPVQVGVLQAISVSRLPAETADANQLAAADGQARALPEQTGVENVAAVETGSQGASIMLDDVLSFENATDAEIERELMREADSIGKGNRKYATIKKKLVEKAKKDPELVSQLIRSLLQEKA